MASDAYARALAYAEEDDAIKNKTSAPADTLSDDFSKGLRSTGNAMGGQLNSLAGLIGENVGADEFAAERRKSAAEYMRDSEAAAPQIGSIKQVDGLRSGLRYAAGMAGSVLPYLGATAAAAPFAGGALLGGAAAMTPLTAGSIVQRQEADPEAMQQTPGARLRDASLGGLVGGAALSLPFGSAMGKVASGALTGMGKRVASSPSLLGATAKNVGEGAATAAIGMGGGNVVEQYAANQNKPIDWQQAQDATIEGAAMGGLMGAPFVPGAYLRGRGEQMKGKAGEAWDKTTEVAGSGWAQAKAAGDAAGKLSRGAWDSAKDVMPEGMRDTAEETGAWVAKRYTEDVKGAIEQVRTWGTEMVNDPNTPADIKKGLSAAMENLRDRTRMSTVVAAWINRGKQATKTPMPEADAAPKTPLEKINEFRDEAPDDTRDMETVAKGEPLGGIKQFADMEEGQMRDALDQSDKSVLQKANDWVIKMADDAGYDQAERDRITEMWGEKKDAATAKIVAAASVARVNSQKYGKKIEDLAKSFGKNEDEAGVKKSEDLSGFRSAMQDAVIPYLKKNMPHLFSTNPTVESRPGQVPMIHPSNFEITADALNRTVTQMSKGKLTSTQMAKLIDTFGEHTMPVMERVLAATGRSLGRGGKTNDVWKQGDARQVPTNGKGRMGENNTMQDQLESLMRENESEASDPTTQQFMELSRLSRRNAEAEDIVRTGLTPEKAEEYKTRDIKPLVDAYQRWADGAHLSRVIGSRSGAPAPKGGYPKTGDLFEAPKAEGAPIKDPGAPVAAGKTEGGKGADGQAYPAGEQLFQTEAGRYNEEAIRQKFAEDFGENADAVAQAFEKRSATRYREEPTEDIHYDADGKPIEEAQLDRVIRGVDNHGNIIDRSKAVYELGDAKYDDNGQPLRDEDGKLVPPEMKLVRGEKRAEHRVDKPKPLTDAMREVHQQALDAVERGYPKVWEEPAYLKARQEAGGMTIGQRLMLDMEHEFPAHNVSWEASSHTEKDGRVVTGRKGYIVAERVADPDKLSHEDIANMRADVRVDPETKQSRTRKEDMIVVHTPNGVRIELDSLRAAWAMDKKAAYTKGSTDALDRGRGGGSAKDAYTMTGGKAQRVAQAALEAMSRIIDTYGSKKHPINIDPNARVGRLGNDAKGDPIDLLWKDVGRYLNPDAKPGEALQLQHSTSMTADRWKAMTPEQKRAFADEVAENEAMGTSRADENARNRAILRDGRPEEESAVKGALRADGRYGTNKDDNIHMAAGDRSAADLAHTSNPDGSASTSFRMLTKAENAKVNTFSTKTLNHWYDVKTPAAQLLLKKADLLIRGVTEGDGKGKGSALHAMTAADRAEFLSYSSERKPSAAAEMINRMYDKYKSALPIEQRDLSIKVKGASEKLKAAGWDEQNMPMPAESTGEGKMVALGKNGKPVTVKPLARVKGEKKAAPPAREELGPTLVRPGPTLEEGMGRASKETPQTLWEESNRPKAVAAKKAALLEAASSSNPDLFRELSTSTDAKALQRAVDALVDTEVPKGAAASRSSDRAAVLVSNKYRNNVTTLSHMLKEVSLDPTYLSGQLFSRDNFRNHPEVKKEMAELLAGRLRGEPDAARALDALRHIEYQFFSMEKSTKTNEAITTALNTKTRGKLGDYMDTIAKSNDVPQVMREIAKKIGEVASDVRLYGVSELDGGTMGLYYPQTNHIEIARGHQYPATLVLHEGAHAATIRALATNEPLAKATYELMEHVAFVSKRTAGAYGMKDIGEFMAEGLSNREFQKELQTIPPSGAVHRFLGANIANAWQEFVAVVRSALKLDPKHDSALSQLFELAGHAMKEVKADPAKGFNLAEGQAWHDRLFANVHDYKKTISRIQDHLPEADAQGRADFDGMISRAEAERGVTYGEQHTADQLLAALDLRKTEGADVFLENPGLTKILIDGINDGKVGNSEANFPADGIGKAIDTANERIRELIKEDPSVAYGLQTKRYSMESAQPVGTKTISQRAEKSVRRFVERVLGPNAEVLFEPMTHAGEFFRDSARQIDVLRVAVTALNPLATAHHEALHGFFGHLRASGMSDAAHVVEKYSGSAHVMTQLRERLKDSPEALKQLTNAEERAAYMFQYYKTDPTFKLMPRAKNFFAKVSEVLHNLMGMWTNDQRAQHIMDYFERGEFATDMGNMNTVHDKLMKTGRNALLEKAKSWVEPMGRLGDSLAGMGGERLRDTGIPALAKIADLVKTTGRGQGGDRGHLSAARVERSVRLNAYATEMSRFTADEHRAALEAMQNGTKATGRARVVQVTTEKTLDNMFTYMKDKGVDISLLADKTGAHYFPRVWDAHHIATNKDAFINMMEKYTRSGQFTGDPREVMRNIMSSEGSSFNVVTRQPGMQAKKERLLRFIDHADAAPFLRKDLMETMDSYVTQGTRRAEWAERFGDDAKGLEALLEKARKEGATQAQIVAAETYLKGVGGTLGDDIDPGLRRLYGNAIIYQNIRLLPLAVFSSLVDPIGIAVRGGTAREALGAFKRGLMEIPQGFKDLDKRTKTPAESTAELLGVIDNAYLHSTLGTLYNQGLVGDFGRNLNDKFFKYNLMEQFNRSMRSAATASAIKFIETHASGKASKHSPRWMQELGLDLKAGDFKADGTLKLYETDGLTKEKAERIKQAVNQWVDGAVLRPDAADKPMWMNDPHFALLSHLKQFTWSFQETILKRVVHEYGYGNYGPALALASYVPMMIAADAAKGALQTGGDEPEWKKDWGPAEYVAAGAQRAGLFGVSQYAIDAYSAVQRGGTGLGGLSGPMLEQMGEAISVAGGRREFSSFVMRALPANAVYSDWVKDSGASDNGPATAGGVE